jgi:hypothetical protein
MKITSLPSSGKFLPSTQKHTHTHTHLSLNLKAQTVVSVWSFLMLLLSAVCAKIRETETTEKLCIFSLPWLAGFCTCDTKALQRRVRDCTVPTH